MNGVLALDLSLTATGWVYANDGWYATDEDRRLVSNASILSRGTITTPSRGSRTDAEWARDRFARFSHGLLSLLNACKPRVLAIEISSVVFGSKLARGRYGPGAQYRAGQGLGRALGWIDGTLALATAYGSCPMVMREISTSDAKLSVAGSRTADKDTVRAKIEEGQSWNLEAWKEAEVDALAILLTFMKEESGLLRQTTRKDGNYRRRESTTSTSVASTPASTPRRRATAAS